MYVVERKSDNKQINNNKTNKPKKNNIIQVQAAAAVATVVKCPMIRKTATSVEYDDGYVTDPRPLAARGCRAVTRRRQC